MRWKCSLFAASKEQSRSQVISMQSFHWCIFLLKLVGFFLSCTLHPKRVLHNMDDHCVVINFAWAKNPLKEAVDSADYWETEAQKAVLIVFFFSQIPTLDSYNNITKVVVVALRVCSSFFSLVCVSLCCGTWLQCGAFYWRHLDKKRDLKRFYLGVPWNNRLKSGKEIPWLSSRQTKLRSLLATVEQKKERQLHFGFLEQNNAIIDSITLWMCVPILDKSCREYKII